MKVKPTPRPGRVVVEVDRKDERLLSAASPTPEQAFSLKRILVPIDFSECSQKALQYALPLARQFGARLLVVYVMPANYFVGSEFGPVDFPVPEAEWREQSRKELEAMARREIGETAAFDAVVLQGQPAHEIAACAQEQQASLIVISTHGRTGLRHVLVGSVAENVVRYAPCPVLVVREHGQDWQQAKTVSEEGI
jgi:nucleotide-binding universal stress UspA family protein